ncbi:hypothetical protein [Synechococcus phage MinM1]|nr:hypothetical protein [Synechococcus phage MinM1]
MKRRTNTRATLLSNVAGALLAIGTGVAVAVAFVTALASEALR